MATSVELASVALSSVSYSFLLESPIWQSKRTHVKLPTMQNALRGPSKTSLHASAGLGRRGAAAAATLGGSPGGCCGGSGNVSGGCGSKRSSDLANVGKEFEAMVAAATLREIEKDYNSAEMQGTITRDIMQEVMNTCVEESAKSEGEKFLDIEFLIDEARSLSKGDFVFEVDVDEVIL